VSGHRKRQSFDLERQLREARPEPGRDLVQSLVSDVRGQRQAPQSLRLAFAGSLTLMLFVALATFGGIGYAGGAPEKVVKGVVAAVRNDNGTTLIHQSPACDQYFTNANYGRGNLGETCRGRSHPWDSHPGEEPRSPDADR